MEIFEVDSAGSYTLTSHTSVYSRLQKVKTEGAELEAIVDKALDSKNGMDEKRLFMVLSYSYNISAKSQGGCAKKIMDAVYNLHLTPKVCLMLYSQSITKLASAESILSIPTDTVMTQKIKSTVLKGLITHRRVDVIDRLLEDAWGKMDPNTRARLVCAASSKGIFHVGLKFLVDMKMHVRWRDLLTKQSDTLFVMIEEGVVEVKWFDRHLFWSNKVLPIIRTATEKYFNDNNIPPAIDRFLDKLFDLFVKYPSCRLRDGDVKPDEEMISSLCELCDTAEIVDLCIIGRAESMEKTFSRLKQAPFCEPGLLSSLGFQMWEYLLSNPPANISTANKRIADVKILRYLMSKVDLCQLDESHIKIDNDEILDESTKFAKRMIYLMEMYVIRNKKSGTLLLEVSKNASDMDSVSGVLDKVSSELDSNFTIAKDLLSSKHAGLMYRHVIGLASAPILKYWESYMKYFSNALGNQLKYILANESKWGHLDPLLVGFRDVIKFADNTAMKMLDIIKITPTNHQISKELMETLRFTMEKVLSFKSFVKDLVNQWSIKPFSEADPHSLVPRYDIKFPVMNHPRVLKFINDVQKELEYVEKSSSVASSYAFWLIDVLFPIYSQQLCLQEAPSAANRNLQALLDGDDYLEVLENWIRNHASIDDCDRLQSACIDFLESLKTLKRDENSKKRFKDITKGGKQRLILTISTIISSIIIRFIEFERSTDDAFEAFFKIYTMQRFSELSSASLKTLSTICEDAPTKYYNYLRTFLDYLCKNLKEVPQQFESSPDLLLDMESKKSIAQILLAKFDEDKESVIDNVFTKFTALNMRPFVEGIAAEVMEQAANDPEHSELMHIFISDDWDKKTNTLPVDPIFVGRYMIYLPLPDSRVLRFYKRKISLQSNLVLKVATATQALNTATNYMVNHHYSPEDFVLQFLEGLQPGLARVEWRERGLTHPAFPRLFSIYVPSMHSFTAYNQWTQYTVAHSKRALSLLQKIVNDISSAEPSSQYDDVVSLTSFLKDLREKYVKLSYYKLISSRGPSLNLPRADEQLELMKEWIDCIYQMRFRAYSNQKGSSEARFSFLDDCLDEWFHPLKHPRSLLRSNNTLSQLQKDETIKLMFLEAESSFFSFCSTYMTGIKMSREGSVGGTRKVNENVITGYLTYVLKWYRVISPRAVEAMSTWIEFLQQQAQSSEENGDASQRLHSLRRFMEFFPCVDIFPSLSNQRSGKSKQMSQSIDFFRAHCYLTDDDKVEKRAMFQGETLAILERYESYIPEVAKEAPQLFNLWYWFTIRAGLAIFKTPIPANGDLLEESVSEAVELCPSVLRDFSLLRFLMQRRMDTAVNILLSELTDTESRLMKTGIMTKKWCRRSGEKPPNLPFMHPRSISGTTLNSSDGSEKLKKVVTFYLYNPDVNPSTRVNAAKWLSLAPLASPAEILEVVERFTEPQNKEYMLKDKKLLRALVSGLTVFPELVDESLSAIFSPTIMENKDLNAFMVDRYSIRTYRWRTY